MRTGPAIGLRQPTAARCVGEGCIADAVRFHIARNADVLVRRVRPEQGRGLAPPTLDEVVAGDAGHLFGKVPGQIDLVAGADAQIVEPGPQAGRFDAVLFCQGVQIGLARRFRRFGRGRQVFVGTAQPCA